MAGGGLQPSSQAILLDTFPPEKQGIAQTVFGMAALIAPVLGPTLGGYITDQYSWRWIFYINVPAGLIALTACYLTVHDPDYLVKERKEARERHGRFDVGGLSLLSVTIVCWEVLLSKGQEWDWFGDPFGRVQLLAAGLLLGGFGLFFWERRQRSPVVSFKPFGERNFACACVLISCAYGVLYGSSTTLPTMLESLFGYDAFHAGLVLSPAGIFSILALIVVGRVMGMGVDARWLIAGGMLVLGAGNYWMSQLNLDISPGQVIWPRVVMITGLGLTFAPLNVAAYLYMPREWRPAAVGLFALLRNEGGSVGISLSQTITERREQFHGLRLGEWLDPLNPAAGAYLDQTQAPFVQQTGDAAGASQMAWQSLSNLRDQQGAALSYFDAFLLFAALACLMALLVLVMKRSAVEKGTHISAE